MKLYIGPYIYFLGPYQIAEKILFWKDKYTDNVVYDLGKWLATNSKGEPSYLTRFCEYIYTRRERTVKIKIHDYDSFNADQTLSVIALPLLKQLKKQKQGAPFVDDSDVPEEIRSTSAKPKENEWDTDEFHFQRWDYVLDCILWSLEQHTNPDSEEKFYDHSAVNEEDDFMDQVKAIKVDNEGLAEHNARKQKGFELLGKYWQAMWS